MKVRNKSNDYDIVRAFLEIDKFYHRFQKIKRPTAYSADRYSWYFFCYELGVLRMKPKRIRSKSDCAPEFLKYEWHGHHKKKKKKTGSKKEITKHDDPSDKSKDSAHVEEVS